MKRVLCAGMRRAGSMFIYNTVRLAMSDKAGEASVQGRYIYCPSASFYTIKVHKFSEELLFGADLVITSHRDPRDVAAEAVVRGLVRADTTIIIKYLMRTVMDEYENWKPFAQLDLAYEEQPGGRLDWVTRITIALDRNDLDGKALLQTLQALPIGAADDIEASAKPRRTEGEAVGCYKKILSQPTINAIEAVFVDWMAEHGYK